MTGIVGQFFKQFALTIAFAVAMSLLVAFTLDPMLSSRFVRFIPPEERRATRIGRFLERWGEFYDRIDQRYHRLLGWAVDHPWSVVAAALVVFVASLSHARHPRHRVRAGRGPRSDGGAGRAAAGHVVRAERGGGRQASRRSSAASPRCGRSSPPSASTATRCGPGSRSRLTSKLQRERGLAAIKSGRPRTQLAAVPMLKATVTDPEFMQGAPSEAPVNIFVRGDDIAALQRLSDEIVASVRQVPGTVDVDSTLEDRPARDGGARQPIARRRPRLRGRDRGLAAARHGRGRGADQTARRRRGVRHPGAAGAGVPQRLLGHRPHAALLAARRRRPHRRHRAHGTRRRPDQHRTRTAPPPGQDRHRARQPRRSATSPPTSRR